MANNSPTIVVGQLNDEELKKSIDKLVANVDEGLQKMLQSTKNAVTEMNKTLKSLGDTKVDFGGSADGGASKRAKAQNAETDAVEKSIAARDKQIKKNQEVSMSFDQIAEALSKERNTVRDFNANRQKGLPSSEEYKRYEQALARIVEYNDKLKQSALGLAAANERAFAFDSRRALNINPIDDRLKQLNKYYAEQEKLSERIYKKNLLNEFGAANSMSTKTLDSAIDKLERLQKIQSNMKDARIFDEAQLNRVENAIERTIEKVKKLRDAPEKSSAKNLWYEFQAASTLPARNVDEMTNKLERMKAAMKAMQESGIVDEVKINRGKNAIDKLELSLSKIAGTSKAQYDNAWYVLPSGKKVNQSADAIRDLNRAVEENRNHTRSATDSERIWAANVRFAGEQAQETSQKIIQLMHAQASVKGDKAITGVKELEKAVQDMRLAYESMSDLEKQSPIGIALKNDIALAEQAIGVVTKYNKSLLGFGDSKVGEGQRMTFISLQSSLKGLINKYRELTVEEINAGKDKGIIDKYQKLSRAAEILQKNLNTPISFKAANDIQVRTLDDMAYKLRQLSAYKQSIDLTNPNAAQEINKVDAAIVQLKKDMDKYMSSAKIAEKETNALTRSFNYMKNRLAFYFTVGASTAFVKNLIDIRAQYEMNERALGILINSAERGTQIFKELSSMALVSPYTLIELSTAAKQLTAYDVAAKDVVDTTRRLADMTAAVGIPIERLTYAIGQVKAYGYLNARDARMFANAGIPLVKELADYYTQLEGHLVSTSDVYDKIKKKAIDYNAVMSVVTKMTDEGGKFFDFQAKMAGTLKVQLANLTLAWNNMLNEIGSEQQGVLSSTIGGLKELFLQWRNIEKVINTVLVAFGLWKTAQLIALAVTGNLTGAMAAQVVMGTKLQAKFASMAAGIKSASIGISAAGMAFWLVLADGIMTYRKNAEEIEQLNKSIADGAKESAESLGKFLESTEIYRNRLSAITGKLPKADAEKTWEALREQMELSSASAKDIIPRLLTIEDVNRRLTVAFNLADRIKDANEKLGDIIGNLDVSQDTILGGIFGEGLAEDLEDYNEKIEYTAKKSEWAANKSRGFFDNAVMGLVALFNEVKDGLGSDEVEAEKEIRKFAANAAKTIEDELGEEGVKDKVKLGEAIARVVQGMEKQFPQIRGKAKMLFETIFNEEMSNAFGAAVDKQAYFYRLFLERLKKDHASAFQDVTNDILADTHTWNSAQLDAINKTAERVKQDLPAASQDAIDKILQQLNNTQFKLRIVTEFATTTQDEVNKQFRKQFIDRSYIEDKDERERQETQAMQKYGVFMKKNNETDLEYQKRISDEKQKQLDISKAEQKIISNNEGKTDAASKAIVANAKEQKKAADDWLDAAEKVEKWGGYDFTTKKESAAAKKEQATAEKEVTEAFKNELSILREMKSEYDKLRKAGVDNLTAIDLASQGYENTLKRVNATLAKYGISKFNAKDFLGKDVNSVLHTLEKQRNEALLSGKLKTGSLKELDTEISKLNVSATTFNMERITKGLNNELDKLKDEYELAIDLDATPELGGVFADMMGISKKQLAELPRDFESLLNKMQQKIDQELGSGKFDISAKLNKSVFERWVKGQGTDLDSELAKKLEAYVDYANKVRQDETKKQVDEWNKLLEKYAEYEYKRKEILETAERERATAIKKGAGSDILAAIENRMKEQLAQLDFEQFMKTPEWITATGDLAGMSHRAIGMLINDLEHYKKSAKNLSPKQIKQLNNALSKLYKEQRKNNPFEAISNMLQEAKDGMSTFDEEIKKAQEEIDELTKQKKNNIAEGIVDDETNNKLNKAIKRLSDLKEKQKEVGEIYDSAWFPAINEMVKAVESAIKMFNDLGKAIDGGDFEYMFDVIDKTLSAAETGNAIGGKWGAIIGAVVGFATALINVFSEARNDEITESVERSERSVKRLETAYNNLRDAVEKAYGTAKYAAEQATIANKKLQLEELKRQLILERSRDGKHRDEDKIVDLEGQIVDLEREIRNTVEDITNDLLGISSVGSAAEDMVSSMIESFKNGEDWMKSFDDTFADMVDNMIMKAIVGRVIGDRIQEIFDMVDQKMNSRGSSYQQQMENLQRLINQNEEWLSYNRTVEEYGGNFLINKETAAERALLAEQNIEKYKSELSALQNEYEKAVRLTPSDVDDVRAMTTGFRDNVKNEFQAYMDMFGIKFGQDAETSGLSALQAGISSVTEDTAGALEAMLNGISQQVYYQSDVLVQIRDAVTSFDMDIQTGSLGQILLQLQTNYIVMHAMQSMMEGWTIPSGQGIRVELIS